MSSAKYVDRVGREVKVGSRVAFGIRKHNSGTVRTATVVEIVQPKKGDHYYLLKTEGGRVTDRGPSEVVVYA